MPKLHPSTVVMLDGDLRLFKRDRSRVWQATFKMDGRWVRVSTKCKQVDDAKAAARKLYIEYEVRRKNGLPVVSKRFASVAAICIADMQKQLDAGVGKKVFKDYIIVLNRYLVPYFANQFVTSITYEELQRFAHWRKEKMGHEPKASTLNTHNSALNRVFDEAVARGYMNKTHLPTLINKGRDSERRPDFTRDEYQTMIRKLPSWIEAGRDGKSRDMRYLLRDYVLILANTGIRHGTEAENLCWKHVSLFEENGLTYLEMSVSGKTGRRDIICRSGTINYLKRIQSRCPDISGMSFEELLKARLDLPVFRLPDGTVSKNLRQTFRILMKDTGLLTCNRTGQNRTLYSLRHTYATFALLNDGMDIHTLAIQMGTSIGMIERHYSHLTPRLRKDMLTGKRFEMTKEDYEQKYSVKTHAVDVAAINQAVLADEKIEDALPEDPVGDDTVGDDTVSEHSVGNHSVPEGSQTKATSAAGLAFDMFENDGLPEAALLAALGVDQETYTPEEWIKQRALSAWRLGKLSEAGLMKTCKAGP
jgi:integrase